MCLQFMMWIFFFLFFASRQSLAFQLIQSDISHPDGIVAVGEKVTLTCTSDNYFEYCHWKHNNQHCEFEWKRNDWAVKKQECSPGLHQRIKYVGKYVEHQCQIQIRNV